MIQLVCTRNLKHGKSFYLISEFNAFFMVFMLFVIGMFCFLFGIYVPILEFLLFSMVFMLWIVEYSRRCLNMF